MADESTPDEDDGNEDPNQYGGGDEQEDAVEQTERVTDEDEDEEAGQDGESGEETEE